MSSLTLKVYEVLDYLNTQYQKIGIQKSVIGTSIRKLVIGASKSGQLGIMSSRKDARRSMSENGVEKMFPNFQMGCEKT